MELSFIIVNFNSGSYLLKCIVSLKQHIHVPFEVIVYDNNSTDESMASIEDITGVISIHGGRNLGFAKACNLAADRAVGKVLWFLNPDTWLDKSIDFEVLKKLTPKANQFLTTNLKDEHGIIRNNVYTMPLVSNYLKSLVGMKNVLCWCQGSSILISRSTFLSGIRWPEEYFMYSEDMDFCYALQDNGYNLGKADYCVTHKYGGVTSKVWSDLERLFRVEEAFYKFYVKRNIIFDYHILAFVTLFRFVWKKNAWVRFGVYLSLCKRRVLGVVL